MEEISHRTVIAAPVADVTGVVLDPGRWATWLVSLGEASDVLGDGGVGTTVRFDFHAADVRFALTSRVVESAATDAGGHHWRAVFDQPIHGWQSLDCAPVGGLDGEPGGAATLVTAELHYDAGDDVLRSPAARELMRVHQDTVVRQSLANLKWVVEG